MPALAVAQGLQATVVSIGVGDTIRVRQGERTLNVRLACIDAPEMAQSPQGQLARDYLRMRLPIGSSVRLDEKSADRYDRTVAEVISEINIGLAMVEDGRAFAYRQYLNGCNARKDLNAEDRASRRRLGVWQQVPGGITRPGISAVHPVAEAFLTAPPPVAAATAAGRSAPMPEPKSCCGRATPISMVMAMGKPVNSSVAEDGRHSPHCRTGDWKSKR